MQGSQNFIALNIGIKEKLNWDTAQPFSCVLGSVLEALGFHPNLPLGFVWLDVLILHFWL